MQKKTVLSAIAIALLAVGGAAAQAPATPAKPAGQIQFDIPAGELIAALEKLGERSHLTLVYNRKLVEGKPSSAINGRMRAEDALRRLLEGTGLEWSFVNDDTVVLKASASSMTGPADQMRVAGLGADQSANSGASKSSETERDSIVVEGQRDKPFTGGNLDIKRSMEDVQPYMIYDAEAVQRSGAITVEDFLKQKVTMNTVALSGGQGNGGGGARYAEGAPNRTTVNLRGLGTDKTVVLINGRRSGDRYGQNFSENLNNIPPSMVERIEVLPTSAAGIYGGSALGGVINIILKRDYTGGTAGVNYDHSENSGDEHRGAFLNYGWSLERGRTRVTTGLNWSDAKPMRLGDRADLYYSSLAKIMANYPDYFSSGAGIRPGLETNISGSNGLTFLDDDTPLGSSISHIPAGTADGDVRAALIANAGVWNTDLPNTSQRNGLRRNLAAPSTNRSVSFGVRRQMFSWLDLSLDLRQNESKTNSIMDALPTSVTLQGDWEPPPWCPMCPPPPRSPFNPFNESVDVSFPIDYDVPLSHGSKSRSASLSADVRLPFNWTGLLDYAHTRSNWKGDSSYFDNQLLSDQINRDGTFNPLVDVAQLAGHDWAQYVYADKQDIESLSDNFSLRFNGPLMSLPWGTPRMTVALERLIATAPGYLRYYASAPSNQFPIPPENVNGGPGRDRQSINSALYGEVLLPLVRENSIRFMRALELQLAGRKDRSTQDNFDGASSTRYSSSNYTYGLRYQPFSELTLRVSRATAFIPPQLTSSPRAYTAPMTSLAVS